MSNKRDPPRRMRAATSIENYIAIVYFWRTAIILSIVKTYQNPARSS